jgi:hypothetical protein
MGPKFDTRYAAAMEKRKSIRHRTFKAGVVSFGFATGIECIVRNISEGGACLEIDASICLPDDFSLLIKPECLKRSCHLAWRGAGRTGVQFAD